MERRGSVKRKIERRGEREYGGEVGEERQRIYKEREGRGVKIENRERWDKLDRRREK